MGPMLARLAKIAIGLLVGGVVYELWKHEKPRLQTPRHQNAAGHDIQVVVPVDGRAKLGVAVAPVPPNNGSAAIFLAPPPVSTGKLGIEPTVITPGGPANLSVDNASDVQNALNALGVTPKLDVDGVVGPKTTANVRFFQMTHGLAATRQVSP